MRQLILLTVFLIGSFSVFSVTKRVKKYTDSTMNSVEVPVEIQHWLDRELKSSGENPVKLPHSIFTPYSKAKVVGYIKDYNPQGQGRTAIIYMWNNITGEEIPATIEIYPDGRFEKELSISYPQLLTITFEDNHKVNFYCEPGKVTGVVFDWTGFIGSYDSDTGYTHDYIQYVGVLARLNKEIFSIVYPVYSYGGDGPEWAALTYHDFKDHMLSLWDKAHEMVKIQTSGKSLLPETVEIVQQRVDISYAAYLLDFKKIKSFFGKEQDNEEMPIDYYDFLSRLKWDNPFFMTSEKFSSFINRLGGISPLRVPGDKMNEVFIPSKPFYQYLRDDVGIHFSDEDMVYIQALDSVPFYRGDSVSEEEKQKWYSNRLSVLSSPFNEKYKEQTPLFNAWNHQNGLNKLPGVFIREFEFQDSVLRNTFHIQSHLPNDLLKVNTLSFVSLICDKKGAEIVYNYVLNEVKDPFIKMEVERMYDAAFMPDGYAYELPETEAGTLFRQLIEPYKGKYLLVDFWGTTCGPCIANIKKQKKLRDSLEDNPDMAFLFITSGTESPDPERYRYFIDEQNMKHSFFLSTDEYKHMRQLFNFNSIPRYIFVDPQGNILDDTYAPGNFEEDVKRLSGKTI